MFALTAPTVVVSHPTAIDVTMTYVVPFRLFAPFSEHDQIIFSGAPVLHPNAGGERRIEPLCRRVVEHIFGLEGIDKVVVRPYEIDITRAKAFEWGDLDEPLKFLIRIADPVMRHRYARSPWMDLTHCVRWDRDMLTHDVRHYALTVRLFAPRHNLDTKRHFPQLAGGKKQPLTVQGQMLVQRLCELGGVDCVYLDPFELHVCKYSDSSWDELHEPILEALSDCFPDEATVVLRRTH